LRRADVGQLVAVDELFGGWKHPGIVCCTAPGSLDTRLRYAARLRLVSRCAARASRGLR
jgi:hypothetical protein